MVTAVNYETSVLNANGEKAMFGGSIRRDVGILLFGDSNMCGAGGDVDPALDATTQQMYYLSGADIVAVNTAATPYIEHSLNDFIDEVGPDLPFCHRYAVERQTSRERIVALGAGDGGSGLSTGQLAVGGDTRTLSKTMVDTLLAQNPFNEIGAIMLLFGANDVGNFTPTTLWRDGFEAIIDAYRSSEFVPNALQKEFIRVPIIVAGMTERLVGNVAGNTASSGLSFVDENSEQRREDNSIAGAALGLLPSAVEKFVPVVNNAARGIIRGGSANTLQKNLDDFAEVGAVPTVGTGTETTITQGLESISSKFFGGGKLRHAVEETTDKIKSRVEGIASEISAKSDDVATAGRTIKDGILGDGGFISRFREKENVLWRQVDDIIGNNKPVRLEATKEALNGLIRGGELGTILDSAKLKRLRDLINGDPKIRMNLLNLASETSPRDVLPYSELKSIRTFIGEAIGSPSDILGNTSRSQLKALYASLSNDIERVATESGAIKAFSRANNFTRAAHKRVDEFVDRVTKKIDPEDVFKMVSRGSESASTINAIKRSLKPEEWEVVASNVIRRLGKANPGVQDAATEVFSVDKFLTDWNKLGKAKNALLSGSQKLDAYRSNLDTIARVTERMKGASKELSNASGSGVFAANAGAIGGAATGLAVGRLDIALGFISAVGLNRGAASLMANPRFVNWLAGSTRVEPANATRYISRLASVANASSDEDAIAIGDYLKSL